MCVLAKSYVFAQFSWGCLRTPDHGQDARATKIKLLVQSGKMTPETGQDRYRGLRVFSYRVLYRILDEERIAVGGVLHGHRLFDSRRLR